MITYVRTCLNSSSSLSSYHISQSKVAMSCKELSRRLTLLGAATAGVHPLILELVKLEVRSESLCSLLECSRVQVTS